jgi:excisionase family DNA binding protein
LKHRFTAKQRKRIFIMEQRNELASQPLLLTIPQVATKLGLSRAMVYNLINREGLPAIHLGRLCGFQQRLSKNG